MTHGHDELLSDLLAIEKDIGADQVEEIALVAEIESVDRNLNAMRRTTTTEKDALRKAEDKARHSRERLTELRQGIAKKMTTRATLIHKLDYQDV
jgi:hypothetical protein